MMKNFKLMKTIMTLGVTLSICLFSSVGHTDSYKRMLNSNKEPQNWLSYYGNYKGWRYSELHDINVHNVKNLVPKWAFDTGNSLGLQSVPIVVDGVMYIATADNSVFAVDALTGDMKWKYSYELPDDMPSKIWGNMHRGVTVINGKVLLGTMDVQLVALDINNGKELWRVKVGEYSEGQGITHPPTIVKNKAIIGISTLEFPTRGSIVALDLEAGEEVWRFYTTAGSEDKKASKTWKGDTWKKGGGGVWLPSTYDEELNLIYFGTGNAHAMYYGDDRDGTNLYTASIVALNPDDGKIKWHFQPVPHDVWDYDTAAGEMLLADIKIKGKMVKALFHADKNGYFYAFNRTNGKYLYAKPFVDRIDWTTGLDKNGVPSIGKYPTPEGTSYCPSLFGGKNFQHMSFNPKLSLMYIPFTDMCNYTTSKAPEGYKTGVLEPGGTFEMEGSGAYGGLEAVDPSTGEIKWRWKTKYPMFSSTLSTAGGLVFSGDVQGNFLAFDAKTGDKLWKFKTGSGHRGSATSFAINGKQYIAVPAGWGGVAGLISAAWPEIATFPTGASVWVFGLPD